MMAHSRSSLTPVHLEGTTLEGGGQLLRLALVLSSLTKQPVKITNIRGRRSGGGGLKTQHLTSVQWLGQACGAGLGGVGLKSKEIMFTPCQSNNRFNFTSLDEQERDIRIDQSTPGSITLVLQAILPYLLFSGAASPIRVRISGGTNVFSSPSCDYILEVLFPMLVLIGVPLVEVRLHSRGWSQGSTQLGCLTFVIRPLTLPLESFQLTQRGKVSHTKAIVLAPRQTEQRFRDELDLMFAKHESQICGCNDVSRDLEVTFEASHHEKRYYLLLIATTTTGVKLGRDWLYDQSVRPGKTEHIIPAMVRKVSKDLISEIEHHGCVDEYMRDQLVVFQALAEGRNEVFGGKRGDELVPPSLHARTAMWVAKEIVGVEFDQEGACEGIGLSPGGRYEDPVDSIKTSIEKLDITNV